MTRQSASLSFNLPARQCTAAQGAGGACVWSHGGGDGACTLAINTAGRPSHRGRRAPPVCSSVRSPRRLNPASRSRTPPLRLRSPPAVAIVVGLAAASSCSRFSWCLVVEGRWTALDAAAVHLVGEMDSVMAAAAPDAPPQTVVLVSAGASHSVALLTGNVLCSWGRGEDGQLGHGDAEDRLVPTVLSGFDAPGVASVICGADHTTAYSEDELQVYSWGWGDFGRLGHGNSSDVFTPQPVKALQGLKIKQIACGDSHCLAVTMAGQVQSWGRNQNGQLGLGTTEDSLLPQKIQAFEGVCVKMIAAGAEHTAAVTEDGDLYGWGWGRYGNLGLGDRNDRLLPEKVSSVEGEKMVLVACGWRHTITVSDSGNLYTYGWSKYGQLGHGDFEDHLVPHKLEALKDSTISQISGGWRHTMALTSEGKLYGWGWNKFGQVGVGNNDDHCSPALVHFPEDQKISQVACGWRHTLALSEKKNVFSWGRGTSGQLGNGEIVDRNTPVLIDDLSTDGSGCKKLESSTAAPFTAKVWVSPSQRYAIVPDENVPKAGADVNVPENDVKRMRVQS